VARPKIQPRVAIFGIFRGSLLKADTPLERGIHTTEAINGQFDHFLERVEASWFRDLAARDLRLTAAATPAIDAGQALEGFHDDVDGRPRPQGSGWDIRASEFGTETMPPGLGVISGAVNGAFIERDGKSLAAYGDPSGRRPIPDTVLLTEARRDVTWAAHGLAQGGAKIVAPDKEAGLLSHPESFWAALGEKRFHDYAQQTTKVPVEAISVDRTVKGGDTLGRLQARIQLPLNASTTELERWLAAQVRAFRTGGEAINLRPHKGQVKLTCTSFGPGNCEAGIDREVDKLLARDSG